MSSNRSGMLVEGRWQGRWRPVQAADPAGRFLRQETTVRNWVTADGGPGPRGEGGFKAEPGRYRLYVSLVCPWAHRTLLARKLKGLTALVPVTVLSPLLGEQGWEFGAFDGAENDPLYGCRYLHQLYSRHDPAFSGRATVPVLWDCQRDRMVNNESADILRMFNTAFRRLSDQGPDLYPEHLQTDIDHWNALIYDSLNNGVYRAGFAGSQLAYDEAVAGVFATLDLLDERLGGQGPYLLEESLTEADLRLFVTLIRFDAAYHGLFKCNLRRISDYPHLASYLNRIYHLPGVAETVNFKHIKAGYYSIRALNPTGIVPAGPSSPIHALASPVEASRHSCSKTVRS